MREQEKDRIGVVLHLTDLQYSRLEAEWEFALPESYQCSFDGLMQCRYAAISVNGEWKAVVGIASWNLAVRQNGPRSATFHSLSHAVNQLGTVIRASNAETLWLNAHQREAVFACMQSESVQYRPPRIPPCLDFEAAAEAVARHYDVGPDQVQISIHRKGSPSS